MQEIVNDGARALHTAGFEWKSCSPDSPHAAVCLATHHFDNDTHTIRYIADNIIATIPHAEKTQIFGE